MTAGHSLEFRKFLELGGGNEVITLLPCQELKDPLCMRVEIEFIVITVRTRQYQFKQSYLSGPVYFLFFFLLLLLGLLVLFQLLLLLLRKSVRKQVGVRNQLDNVSYKASLHVLI